MPRARKTTARKSTARKSGSRKKATSKRTTASTAAANGSFVCPECGKQFSRAASLGAHRNRAHGVAGSSARPRTRGRRAATGAARTSGGGGGAVNRDALLAALFPKGIPARENVIREVNKWLDQAERLAKSN